MVADYLWEEFVTPRQYEKGERRYKHVGRGAKPVLSAESDHPRHVVGKCPSTIPDAVRQRLLDMAVPLANGDRELTAPKKIYAVYEGAIYEAQTSDQGHTYHAYPFKGKLSDTLLGQLRSMAEQEECLAEFEKWVKSNIVRHGR